MTPGKDTVIVTGSSGFIGRALVRQLTERYAVAGFDLREPKNLPPSAAFVPIDLTSDDSVRDALERVRQDHGDRIASVIHLAAYFDLTGEPNPKYEQITVRGTERLLRALQAFQVEQFVFASTMLVHAAGRPGERINEERALEPKLPYRASKVETERLVREQRGGIPTVFLRPAGIYDDRCSNPFLARQVARIHERSPKGHVYPGDLRTGQSFLHLEDLVDAVLRLVERRSDLPPELPLLLGEPDVMGYGELQREIARLIHGRDWKTWQVPKALAKVGAWLEDDVLGEEAFIKPWMVDIADDHYALDISRAQTLLDWQPKHALRTTLPRMIAALKADPPAWYRANKLNAARVATTRVRTEPPADQRKMHEHVDEMHQMHIGVLWAHFVVIGLGAWLLTSPFQFALFDPASVHTLRDVTGERSLWDPGLRNTLTGWSDIASGLMLMLFGALALSPRFTWAQWGTTCVGLWLLFAPMLFWTPSAAVYANDTAVGALAITLSVLVPMMPGMSHEGMMDPSTRPPGWTYNPSSWPQRIPIIMLGFFGFLIARYLAAYQFGHVGAAWDPVFSGRESLNGTEDVITSYVSLAFPISDAAFGGLAYMLETAMGAMGSEKRWRTMPWMVTFFFILVVPLGAVSIGFIMIQPVMIGTYCTLCLIQAFAMLVMIPLAIDEVVAMGQYMVRSRREGRPFWRTFFQGGPDPAAGQDDNPGLGASLRTQTAAAVWGVTLPWTLIASCVVGAWLMFSRLVFETAGPLADSDHLVGAMTITIAVIAMAEVVRPLRLLNVFFGLWLLAAPWLLADGLSAQGAWNDLVAGIVIITLSLPRGARGNEHYGGWDRYVV